MIFISNFYNFRLIDIYFKSGVAFRDLIFIIYQLITIRSQLTQTWSDHFQSDADITTYPNVKRTFPKRWCLEFFILPFWKFCILLQTCCGIFRKMMILPLPFSESCCFLIFKFSFLRIRTRKFSKMRLLLFFFLKKKKEEE